MGAAGRVGLVGAAMASWACRRLGVRGLPWLSLEMVDATMGMEDILLLLMAGVRVAMEDSLAVRKIDACYITMCISSNTTPVQDTLGKDAKKPCLVDSSPGRFNGFQI